MLYVVKCINCEKENLISSNFFPKDIECKVCGCRDLNLTPYSIKYDTEIYKGSVKE